MVSTKYTIALCLLCLNAWADSISVKQEYFSSRAERLGNGLCSTITYEKEVFKQGYLEASVGYMPLIAKSENNLRQEVLTVIPINLGLRYQYKYISLIGGATLNNFRLDTAHVPSKPGGYIGMELATQNKSINFFVNVKRTFGDLDIDYALLEQASNMKGMLYGGGIRIEW